MRKRAIAVAGALLIGSLVGPAGFPLPAFAACDPAIGGAECEALGPALTDFVDIRQIGRAQGVAAGGGSFTSVCGRNERGHRNSDNHIVAPGVTNGAHHVHDYVGNVTTSGFSTDQSLAAGGTTCRNGDRSAYFWPILRLRPDIPRQGQNNNQNQRQQQQQQQQQDPNQQQQQQDPNQQQDQQGQQQDPSAQAQQQQQGDQAAPNDQAVNDQAAQQGDQPVNDQAGNTGQTDQSQQQNAENGNGAAQSQTLSRQQQPQPDNSNSRFGNRGGNQNGGNNNGGQNGQQPQPQRTGQPPRPGQDGSEIGGFADGNVGRILTPRVVQLQFRGNRFARVSAMPRFLRVITGDAKAATNGPANARAQWTCSGFTNRASSDKYPVCPRGSLVVRVLDFPSCWDGQNTDSANHRTHIVFPDQSGRCPQGTRPVPQLRMTLAYAVPQGASFAVDSFPEQKHSPITDHADFHNVMPNNLMNFMVSCINRNRRC
ncbi:DUF1996 domain-containing protein [Herbidospora cretacea]|uniref:DUF1996 domain-containing protein n=1 Tax=Herbidospora cretacea TaxID=28444 RepID=UPI00077350BB|nr:DUF1996 domain-containing protein [Herbidospora cretacea]